MAAAQQNPTKLTLFTAVGAGNIAEAVRLLEEKASPQERDAKGRTPLHCLTNFLSKDNTAPGIQNDKQTLNTVIGMLIKYGADLEAQTLSGRSTPLHHATVENRCLAVEMLLFRKARVDIQFSKAHKLAGIDWKTLRDEGRK